MSSHDGERRKSWHGLGPCIYRVCVLWNLYLTLLPRHLCITHGERTHESRELWRRCTSRFGKLTTHAHGMHVRCFNVHQVEGVATSPVTYSIASQIIHHFSPVRDDHVGVARGVRGSATAHVDMLKQKETVICTIGEETVLARGLIHQLHFTYTHLVHSLVATQRIQRTRLVLVVLVVACRW